MSDEPRPHQILRVQPDAPDDIVRAAYRARCRELELAKERMLSDEWPPRSRDD
jgi:hypothetical protein